MRVSVGLLSPVGWRCMHMHMHMRMYMCMHRLVHARLVHDSSPTGRR